MPVHKLEPITRHSGRLVREIKEAGRRGVYTHGKGLLYTTGDGPLPRDFPSEMTKGEKYGRNAFGSESHSPELLTKVGEILKSQESKAWYGIRTIVHVGRLTERTRTQPERRFGLDVLRFMGGSLLEKRHNANSVIRGETYSTSCWWTLSPYLHREFLRRGLSPKQSMRILADWAESAEGDYHELWLPGISIELMDELGALEHPETPKNEKIMHQTAEKFARMFADRFIKAYAPNLWHKKV
ncbi:MAG: hypothetical protein NT067_01830 [Candidatus Diapherotrites archaeon]|nr:hypothetical protein [Candidatus Diapherotrites archaeon]